MTGMEWLVRLVFRVGKGCFDQDSLEDSLGIKPLDETEGLEVYGTESRVRVVNLKKQPWQSVTILAHYLHELKTPAFRKFLKAAAVSHQSQIVKMSEAAGDFMPWQLLRDKWHLSEKGFPPGKGRRWDGAILQELIGLIRKILPTGIWEFDKRDVVNVRLSEGGRIWAILRTKDSESLRLRLNGPSGAINLSQLTGIGVERSVREGANRLGIVQIAFQKGADFSRKQIGDLLAHHLKLVQESE
jgi:excinuclease ABC subunit A